MTAQPTEIIKSENEENLFDRRYCHDVCIGRLRLGIHAYSHPYDIA